MIRQTRHERGGSPFERCMVSHVVGISLLLALAAIGLSACSTGGDGSSTSPTSQATEGRPTARASAVPGSPTPAPTATATATATATITATAASAETEPLGFPIDPALKLGLVIGTAGSRTVRWGAGPDAETFSRYDQPSDDPEAANRSGWNCRVHVEYEGQPAIDWYIPEGTAVRATMDGTATLYAITVTNAFDYYGVAREPYLGNPDRARASVSPFPGPSGGKGIFVRVENAEFIVDYAHLNLAETAQVLPAEAFLSGYGPDSDYVGLFTPIGDVNAATPIARWPVKRGDVIGLSGDSGYSEAPHLHYTIRRVDNPLLLCPTEEAAFEDGGWLAK
jgi:hypothetical protein